ncbi:MAG: CRTAC1 family protein [Chloroflexota bacterium]
MRRILLLIAVVLLGCGEPNGEAVETTVVSFTSSASCSGQFVAHDLPHVTAVAVERIGFFISNGSGLAVNDLDNDGDLDVVLGNIFGPNQIFWNDGGWTFRAETLFEGSTRAVVAVDLDGDAWLDLVFAGRSGSIRYWHNDNGRFTQDRLDGVDQHVYSLDFGDNDGDGDLDLVTASYDASLKKQNPFYNEEGRAGVTFYENENGRFVGTKLADTSEALAVQLGDLDGNGTLDILVGNDFDVRDYVWLGSEAGWEAAEPFATTAMSTMSLAVGDVDNNGRYELFAADMFPYSNDPEIADQWQPIIENMTHDLVEGDPQQMANVLQVQDENGSFIDGAAGMGVDATGWSWSSKFGDLNQDGHLDLYVVNGMQALDNFSHLPNDELVEENQAYRNDGSGNFVAQPGWVLNSTAGGRSMSMADLDNDGDLDIIINNLGSPTQLFENQLCEGNSLQIDLRQPELVNTYAIGSELTLHTSTGSYKRRVTATSGYLSGDPSRVHFGFPPNTTLESLNIQWPDGTITTLEAPTPDTLTTISRQ